jgi:hypothetical protein
MGERGICDPAKTCGAFRPAKGAGSTTARSSYAILQLTNALLMLESIYPVSPLEGWPRSRTRESTVSATAGRDAFCNLRLR